MNTDFSLNIDENLWHFALLLFSFFYYVKLENEIVISSYVFFSIKFLPDMQILTFQKISSEHL